MSAWFDIIIFAAVAVFLALRLRSVLGERNSDEPQQPRPNPYTLPPATTSSEPVAKPMGDVIDATTPPKPRPSAPPDSLHGRLELIAQSDSNFSEKSFVTGAKGAFQMIIGAFAAEDTAALRPLLSDDVYDSFAGAIRARQAAKEKLETKVVRITEAEIVDATLAINNARVVVRFVSEQIQCTKDANGAVVDGSDTASRVVTDRWTFSRNLRALDPNWQLAETRSEG